MSKTYILDNKYHREFVFGGNATFTVVNENTGNRATFRVRQAKANPSIHYVQVMVGSDNESSYEYIGHVWKQNEYNLNLTRLRFPAANMYKATTGANIFKYIFRKLMSSTGLPENVQLLHAGKCGACGRKLTTPESIEIGLGPICDGRS